MRRMKKLPDEFFIGRKLKCYICGTKSRQGGVNDIFGLYNVPDLKFERSGNSMSHCDLDSRPIVGFGRYGWIQRCPHCGYCSVDISERRPHLMKIVQGQRYVKQLSDPDYPERVNSFLCKAIIDQEYGNYASATWSLIHAAWNCDDLSCSVQASLCRQKAAEMLVLAVEHGQTVYSERPSAKMRLSRGSGRVEEARRKMSTVILIDLLRRSGKKEEARELITARLADARGPFREIIKYQDMLIEKGDLARHSLSPSMFALINDNFELGPIEEDPLSYISPPSFIYDISSSDQTEPLDEELAEYLYVLEFGDLHSRIDALKYLGRLRYGSAKIYSELLHDDDETIRLHAAWAIGRSGDRSGIKHLITALKDESCYVRLFVVRALGKFDDARSIRALKRALKDENVHVRIQSLNSLAMDIMYQDVDLYRRYAKKENDEALINTALIILGKLRRDPAFVIPSIINIIRKEKEQELAASDIYDAECASQDETGEMCTKQDLTNYNASKRLVREYFESLKDMQDECGAEEEEKIPEDEYIYEEIDPDDVTEIEESEDDKGKNDTYWQGGYEMYLDSLIDELNKIDYGDVWKLDITETCSSILKEYGYAALNPLIDFFEDRDSPWIDLCGNEYNILLPEAVALIWEIERGKWGSIDFLFRALRDEDYGVREVALRLIGELSSEQIIEPLLDFLDDCTEEYYKQHVLPVLVNLGTPVIAPLLNRLVKTKLRLQEAPTEETNSDYLWEEDIPM